MGDEGSLVVSALYEAVVGHGDGDDDVDVSGLELAQHDGYQELAEGVGEVGPICVLESKQRRGEGASVVGEGKGASASLPPDDAGGAGGAEQGPAIQGSVAGGASQGREDVSEVGAGGLEPSHAGGVGRGANRLLGFLRGKMK